MIDQYKFSQFIELCLPGETPDWVDLADPTPGELAEMENRYGLPQWSLTDPLDPGERPRVDVEDQTVLIVARLSVREPDDDAHPVHTVPVGIILTEGLVVTVCRRPALAADHLRRLFRRKRNWTNVRLAFALFYAAGTGFIEHLGRLEALAGEAEARLRQSPENEELLELMNIEKALIDITVALKSNHDLMGKFRQSEPFAEPFGLRLTKDELDLLDDALTENQQAVFMAEIFGQVLSSMSDAFGSLIANNLNKIMKFLAGITIVLMLPNIFTGLYGMNVILPGAGLREAFAVICGLSLGLMLVVSVLFAKKKWF